MTNAVLNEKNHSVTSEETKKERVRILAPRVDIYSDEENIYLLADLPGVEEKTFKFNWKKTN
ncbi:hypothetical protein LEP1GSC116_0828 [Leptospira interrogans serovar Icterohaemorrhagiae str. Verdun HP]|uniref:Uncharacterized protein n=1 Tax=Leptospira interrogans serovar Icterohaemorrhagiae str. Verdun HP TaxID=1049910 RepID=M6RD21_LEPIR|nr:hypothetical protein LEP1GSC116_0828 [Leptospira interrogans serovar Icterohaemorrhagiae str. Verdun HP]